MCPKRSFIVPPGNSTTSSPLFPIRGADGRGRRPTRGKGSRRRAPAACVAGRVRRQHGGRFRQIRRAGPEGLLRVLRSGPGACAALPAGRPGCLRGLHRSARDRLWQEVRGCQRGPAELSQVRFRRIRYRGGSGHGRQAGRRGAAASQPAAAHAARSPRPGPAAEEHAGRGPSGSAGQDQGLPEVAGRRTGPDPRAAAGARRQGCAGRGGEEGARRGRVGQDRRAGGKPVADLSGLQNQGTAPFDLGLALPVSALRTFWLAQADAVAAKPFTCPALSDLNEGFAKLGPAMQKAAIPPFGDLLGVRVALDSLASNANSSLPTFSGRLVLATSNPSGLLAMGQMMVPALAQLKPSSDGKPVALPAQMAGTLGQPAWVAMSDKALALGVGNGEEAKLADTLKEPGGSAGQMTRMHLSGAMYLSWVQLMQDKVDALAAAASAMSKSDDSSGDQVDAAAARSKAQFAAMKLQAERIDSIDAEMHVDHNGMVITSQTVQK